jgi:hypothetical protein
MRSSAEEKLGPTCQASTKLGSEEEILAGDVLLGEEIWTATRCVIAPRLSIWGYLFVTYISGA